MKKKTAVYCSTIEEYNIVAKHYNRKTKEYFTSDGLNCIHTDDPNCSHSLKGLRGDSEYDDIPFNEWILTEMPRVGDKVIITKSDRNWASLMDKYDGKIVIVASTHEESRIQFDDCGDWIWNFLQGHFRIATPEEISNYEKSKHPEDKYVKITGNHYMYTTHSKAKEYGCTNYDYHGNLSNGTTCKVIATPFINDDDGYTLEYNNKHYLISQSGTIPATKEEYEAQFKGKDSCLFVKGQWYKLCDSIYIKFNYSALSNVYNALCTTEEIINGIHKFRINYYNNNNFEQHALEYPLEKVMGEIQPFLPEGHPDKTKLIKNDYIIGSWYKLGTWRVKFLRLEENKFYGSIFITPHDGYVDNTEGNLNLNKHPSPELMADLSEIQPFLPEGHEDKVVEISPKEPVYIAGRWYKMNNCWYSKCSNSSFNKEIFYGNESYNSDGEYDDFEFITTLEEQNSIIELTESTIDDKTPIELKIIICGDMKNDKKPEPKYKVGDELESCKGGWQFIETDLECQNAISYLRSDINIIKGKCTKVKWSNAHQIWWYRIGDYGNMFTESGVKLVDKMKSIEPEYSKYTIKLNSQEEYEQCLDYFENALIFSTVDRMFGFTKDWNKFKYDRLRNLWRLHGYDDTVENVVSLQDFINNIAKIPYTAIPKFSKGDKVRICSSEEDADKNGIMYSAGGTEQILGVAGGIGTLAGEIKEKNGDIYYRCEGPFAGYIKESCLSLVEDETVSKNNAINLKDGDKITEYAGLKVGDILKEKDINEWRKIGENYEFNGIWEKSSSRFYNDRHIKSFKLINGVVGFKVSGTANVYLRADGYLDFIKNKAIEKNDSSLEPISVESNILTNKFNDDIISIPSDCPFKEGDSVSCIIDGTLVEDGKIHFEDGYIYICQDVMDGDCCKNKLGYLYSWRIYLPEYDANFTTGLESNYIENLKLKEALNDIEEDDYSQKTLNLLKKQITII